MENSGISWCDHTHNISWGCTEVSDECDDCYARWWAERTGFTVKGFHGFEIWGHNEARRTFGEEHWNKPLKWNREARAKYGRPARVFCSSMCDIFEVHPTIQQELKKLPSLIERTPDLEWLCLTKRALEIKNHPEITGLPNVRMGVTVGIETSLWRIVPGVQWLSMEPLLGRIPNLKEHLKRAGIKWVVLGGESKNRPCHQPRLMEMAWAEEIIDICKELGIAAHFKQTGDVLARKLGLKQKSGKEAAEWPAKLRVQEFANWQAAA
jgi:protein gp37